jgi:hypothetical protein
MPLILGKSQPMARGRMMTDTGNDHEYERWRRAIVSLKGDSKIHWTDTDRINGFYRQRNARTKVDQPVAIWGSSPNRIALVGGKAVAEGSTIWHDFIAWGWPKCAPVTYEEYKSAGQSGYWPDGKAAKHVDEAGMPVSRAATNEPPAFDALADQIEAAIDSLKDLPPIEAGAVADRVSDALARLRQLRQQAYTAKRDEKRPHEEQVAAVERKWSDIIDPADEVLKFASGRLNDWLRKEEQRLAREAAAASVERGSPSLDPIQPPRAQAGSAFSPRRTSLRTKRVGVVTDAKAFALHLLDNNDLALADFLNRRAQDAARSKVTMPGMEIKEER